MKTASDWQVRQWTECNIGIHMAELSVSDADMWLLLAEERTSTFFRLAEQGFKLSRKKANLAPPISRREVTAFLLEFRIKIQMVHDCLPTMSKVPLFDFGGHELFKSQAFMQAKMLYGSLGGAA